MVEKKEKGEDYESEDSSGDEDSDINDTDSELSEGELEDMKKEMKEDEFDRYMIQREARLAMQRSIKKRKKEMRLQGIVVPKEEEKHRSLASSKVGKSKMKELVQLEYKKHLDAKPKQPEMGGFFARSAKSIIRSIRGEPPPVAPPREKMDIKGFMNAASRDRYYYLQTRIERKGWPADLQDDDGRCGLWCAALEGQDATVGMFIKKGVDVEMRDYIQGWTPLHACCTGRNLNNVAVAERLLKAKADVDAKDKRGRTPLMLALISNNIELAETLIAWGASIDKRDRGTWMAIHHAAFDGREDAVDLLLENRSRYKRKDQYKMRPRDWAERMDNEDVSDTLKSWGLDNDPYALPPS